MENAIVKLRRSRAKQLWLPMFEDLVKVYRRRIRLVDGKWPRGAEHPRVRNKAGPTFAQSRFIRCAIV